jgi:tRNA (guanine10-N2)-methyltransferase
LEQVVFLYLLLILSKFANFSAFTYGCDIDIRVLKGYGIGYNKDQQNVKERKKKMKKNEDPDINIFTNFKHYELRPPQILRADINHPSFRQGEYFDAIVCDPPYGHRAFTRKTGMEDQKKEKRNKRIQEKYDKNKEEINDRNTKTEEDNTDIFAKDETYFFAPLLHCSVEQIFENLLNLGDLCLKKGGILVCLYPTQRKKDELEYFILK